MHLPSARPDWFWQPYPEKEKDWEWGRKERPNTLTHCQICPISYLALRQRGDLSGLSPRQANPEHDKSLKITDGYLRPASSCGHTSPWDNKTIIPLSTFWMWDMLEVWACRGEQRFTHRYQWRTDKDGEHSDANAPGHRFHILTKQWIWNMPSDNQHHLELLSWSLGNH